MTNLIAAIVALVGTIFAIVGAGMTVWHTFGMLRGIRGSASWWVNLIPFIGPALPGALDSQVELHRAKTLRWGLVTAGAAVSVLLARYFAQI
jgi:hypothetical protein